MRVGPTTPIVPIVVVARLERRRDDRGLPLPRRGVLGADRDVQHRGVGPDVLQHGEHLGLPLQRLEQAAKGLASHLLGFIGQVRDPTHHHVGGTVTLRGLPEQLGDVQQQVVLIGPALGRQLQQVGLGRRVGLTAQRGQLALGLGQARGLDALGPVDHALVHPAVLADRQDHHRGAEVDQLQAHDRFLDAPTEAPPVRRTA